MNTILIALGIGLLSLFNPQPADIQMASQQSESSVFVRPELSGLDIELERARSMMKDDPSEALRIFEELEQSGSHTHMWAAISEQVRIYRVNHDFESALETTERVMELEPPAAGLMHVWNGDIYLQAEDYENALAEYELAEQSFGDNIVNNKTVGETALKQATRASIKFKHPETAAQYARKLATDYSDSERSEVGLAWALFYEAMAEGGDLPIMAMEIAMYTGVCGVENPCYIQDKHLYRKGEVNTNEFQELNNGSGIYFNLTEQDTNILERINNPVFQHEDWSLLQSLIPAAHAEQYEEYQTCIVEDIPAYSGFALPISDITYGDLFMGYPATGGCQGIPGLNYTCSNHWYHPGIDLNNSYDHYVLEDDEGNIIEEDSDLCTNQADGFSTTAAGCVQDVDVGGFGSLTITHNYAPFNGSYASDYVTSQYGHADEIDVSEGADVALGDEVGSIGGLGDGGVTFACHLHFEIREEDHPDPYWAGYWLSATLNYEDLVGQYYQDPESFIEAHPAFDWLHWIDEGASWWTHVGSWVDVYTKGNGDGHQESDLKYTSTTSSPNPTATATLRFTADNSGYHQLYMFAPWSTQTKSDSVPVEITEVDGGNLVYETTLDFAGGYRTCDWDVDEDGYWESWRSWKRCDEWILVGSVDLTEGEEYEMYISNATGSDTDIIIIDDLYIIYEDGYEPPPVLGRVIVQNDDEDDCSVPGSGDWTVSSDCTISSDEVAPANVIVADGITLTINGNGSLDMDLSNYHLRIGIGSRVIIGVGGKID
ncbi:MAG: tetratricopeptide repeat protein [Candidatus Uhrbacteria bacterium]